MGLVSALAQLTGMPDDNVTAFVLLLSGFALAIPFRIIPEKKALAWIRNLYSIIVSTGLLLSFFTWASLVEVYWITLVTYFVTRYNIHARQAWIPLALFCYVFAHLCWRFFQSQVMGWTLEGFDDVIMMLLIIKMSSFSWSVYDGTRPSNQLWPVQQRLAIKEFPSLLEFLGYAFFFPSFACGPAMEFKDYQKFIRVDSPFDRLPSRLIPTLKAFGTAFASLGVYLSLASTYNFDVYIAEWMSSEVSIWKRYGFIMAAGLTARTRYYVAWKLSAAACNLVGFGYSGSGVPCLPQPTVVSANTSSSSPSSAAQPSASSGTPLLTSSSPEPSAAAAAGTTKPTTTKSATSHLPGGDWSRGENVSISGLEFGTNPRKQIAVWNIKTAAWLRACVYLRVARPVTASSASASAAGKPSASSSGPGALAAILTYTVSAFWHGFHPGFYMTFISGALFNIAGRNLHRCARPFFHHPKSPLYIPTISPALYTLIAWFLSFVTLNVLAAPYLILRADRSWQVWGSIGYAPLLVIFGVMGVVSGFGLERKVKRIVEKWDQQKSRRKSDVAVVDQVVNGLGVDKGEMEVLKKEALDLIAGSSVGGVGGVQPAASAAATTPQTVGAGPSPVGGMLGVPTRVGGGGVGSVSTTASLRKRTVN